MAKKKIKQPKANTKSKITANESAINYDDKPPVFSLERLQTGDFCLQCLDQEGKAFFADAIFRRKSNTWREIKQMPRHGLGFEKIDKKSISAPMPSFITPDVNHFLSFRFHGKRPMVGYRQNEVFYVLWFDKNFSLYDHG